MYEILEQPCACAAGEQFLANKPITEAGCDLCLGRGWKFCRWGLGYWCEAFAKPSQTRERFHRDFYEMRGLA